MERKLLLYILLCAIPAAVILLSENFEVSSTPTVTAVVGQDVILPCQISTRRQPENMEVQWKKIIQAAIETVHEYRAQTGQDAPGQKYQGRTVLLKNGFASGNVSLKLKNVQPADVGIYSCIVKSNEWSADDTTELKLAGDVCTHGSPWLAAFWVLFVFDILVIATYAFWRYKGNCWKKQGTTDADLEKDKQEKEALLSENVAEQLQAQNQKVQQENEALLSENEQLQAKNQAVLSENVTEQLQAQNQAVLSENEKVKQENKAVLSENVAEQLQAQNQAVLSENEAVLSENEAVLSENVAEQLQAQNQKVQQENEAVLSENVAEQLQAQNQKVQQENKALLSENEAFLSSKGNHPECTHGSTQSLDESEE